MMPDCDLFQSGGGKPIGLLRLSQKTASVTKTCTWFSPNTYLHFHETPGDKGHSAPSIRSGLKRACKGYWYIAGISAVSVSLEKLGVSLSQP